MDKLKLPRAEAVSLTGQIKDAIKSKYRVSGKHYSFNRLYSRRQHYVWEVNADAHGIFTVRFRRRFGRWVILSVEGGFDLAWGEW